MKLKLVVYFSNHVRSRWSDLEKSCNSVVSPLFAFQARNITYTNDVAHALLTTSVKQFNLNLVMKKLLMVLTTVAGLWGCQKNATDLTNEQRAAIANDVNQIVTTIYDLAGKKDLSIYKHFSDSTTGIFSGTMMGSWEEHKRQMADFFSGQEKVESEIEIIDTDVLSSSTAIVLAKYKMTATNKEGLTFTSPLTCITYVFNKTNGQWKIVHFHDSEPKEQRN